LLAKVADASVVGDEVRKLAKDASEDTSIHREMYRKMEIVDRLKQMMFESDGECFAVEW
jgi:hypothetical protein